jgi:hypothetical protein
MMRLPLRSAPSPCVAPAAALAASASTWHHRLRHLGIDVLSKLSSDSSVFALGAPMISVKLASSIITLACLLSVLHLVQIIFLT